MGRGSTRGPWLQISNCERYHELHCNPEYTPADAATVTPMIAGDLTAVLIDAKLAQDGDPQLLRRCAGQLARMREGHVERGLDSRRSR
jgi:hypothetical protein